VSVGENDSSPGAPSLTVVETVRCLGCGAVYSKPAGGGTVQANPGCPECGYLGWLSTSIPFSEDALRRRSAEDPPRRHSA
jgi:predicted  nucleic acid-binding Zn-ribbon protein